MIKFKNAGKMLCRTISPMLILALMLFPSQEAIGSDNEIYNIANNLIEAVINKDIEKLMAYVSKDGTWFIDTAYSYDQINKSMKDKDGWLHHHLFIGDKSVKEYFEKAKDIKIHGSSGFVVG
jgi:hypothetical protein